jgi:hypothetical protein
MKRKRILVLGLSILILAVLVIYPWKRVVVVPAIRVRILDEAGNPAPGAVVQEKWEYRSIGSKEYREMSKADENGYASFPERTERISLLRLVPSVAREIIHLPHGYGFGSSVTVWAYGDDPHVWYYVPFSWYERFPQEIRLKRHYEIRTPDDNKWP